MSRLGPPVLVIGAGWAGLAAAVELAAAGVPVRVLEAARRPGGRARAVRVRGQILDNGQHLLLGACRELLRLLRLLGVDEHSVLHRRRLTLPLRHRDGRRVTIRTAPLPAPLNLVLGLAASGGLPLPARWAGLRRWRRLRAAAAGGVAPTLTVAELLQQTGQPPALVSWLWEPLCLAAMNTPAGEAAAAPFLATLLEALGGNARNADLLLPRGSLEAVLTAPALRFLAEKGTLLESGRRVDALEAGAGAITALCSGGERLPASRVIVATPPAAACRLLQSAGLQAQASTLAALEENAISTIYLRLASPEGRPALPLVGLLGTTAQWCFDRGEDGDPGLLSVVVSADPCTESTQRLGQRITAELSALWPGLRIADCVTLRERRATFRASPANEARRPAAATALRGLWLAGDYTRTGLPATLEGAVRSGVTAARLAIAAG